MAIKIDERISLKDALNVVLVDDRLTLEESLASIVVQVVTAYGYDVESYVKLAKHNMDLINDGRRKNTDT